MIDLDNGPEVSSHRTQFISRLIEFSDKHNLMIELVYYPPYHSKYNRIERCWGVLEQHWNGTQLTTLEMAFAWAKSMTCCPGLTQSRDDNLSRSVNSRGVANTQTTLGRAFVKKLPRELSVLPRSGFVGTFLLSGCLIGQRHF